MNTKKAQPFSLERISIKFTRSVGSPVSILLHTFFFAGIFVLSLFGVAFDTILLVLTTLVSLEAIYLAIFIQMSVNRQSRHISEVRRDIDEIQEDVAEITEDIDEIQEDVEDITEDMEEDDQEDQTDRARLQKIEAALQALLKDIEAIRGEKG